MSDLFTMHPKYPDFLRFMADCPHRKNLEHMELGFWVWLKFYSDDIFLLKDLDRLHRERDSFLRQCAVMASENERLSDELMQIKRNIAIALDYGSVSERGEACVAIDGGNL